MKKTGNPKRRYAPDRGCVVPDQPQRLRNTTRSKISEAYGNLSRCGWCSAHSRGPLRTFEPH